MFLDELESFLVPAFGGQGHVALNGYVGRACSLARRGSALFDGKCARDRLRVSAERGAPAVEAHIVFIAALYGADLGALTATGAFQWIDIPGLPQYFHGKVAGLAVDFADLGKCQKLYVEMPADLDQLG